MLKAGVVGVALGAGSADIALASADIMLIGGDLRPLATCVLMMPHAGPMPPL